MGRESASCNPGCTATATVSSATTRQRLSTVPSLLERVNADRDQLRPESTGRTSRFTLIAQARLGEMLAEQAQQALVSTAVLASSIITQPTDDPALRRILGRTDRTGNSVLLPIGILTVAVLATCAAMAVRSRTSP